jgi:hypothetical protein
MKLVVKQMVITLVALLVAMPAMAAGPIKGTKSYQAAARSEKPAQLEDMAQAPTNADDVSRIAPAAGDMADVQADKEQVKTMREEMRLPRKN